MGFDDSGQHADPLRGLRPGRDQHGVGLAHAGRCPEVHAQLAAHRLARGVAQAQFQQQRCWHAGLRHMRRAGRHQFDVIAADELAIEMDIDVVAARLHRVAHAESRQVFADETTGEAFAEFHFATGSGVCG
ncbi:hypothetical protein G6F62_013850 [Rhizopus arrhizus]|nr:hypothetical protein G6F62_013850 [Rhizopus arrhizus]